LHKAFGCTSGADPFYKGDLLLMIGIAAQKFEQVQQENEEVKDDGVQ